MTERHPDRDDAGTVEKALIPTRVVAHFVLVEGVTS
jgi:hypothetical protein